MKAPDKIYLEKFPSGTLGVVWNDTIEECGRNEPIPYIRKDALLEWLESKIYEHNEDRFDDGFNTALGQVIDKINSL